MIKFGKKSKVSRIFSFVLSFTILAAALPMNVAFAATNNPGMAVDIEDYDEKALKEIGWTIDHGHGSGKVAWESSEGELVLNTSNTTTKDDQLATLYNHGDFGDMDVEFDFTFGPNANMNANGELFIYAKKTSNTHYAVKFKRASTNVGGDYDLQLLKGGTVIETKKNIKLAADVMCKAVLSANGDQIKFDITQDGVSKASFSYKDPAPLTRGGYGMSGKHRKYFTISHLGIGPLAASALYVDAESGNNKVTLSWNEVEDVLNYTIFKGTSESNLVKLADVNADKTTYEDTAVTNETAYYYVVTANNEAGEGKRCTPVKCIPANPDKDLPKTIVNAIAGYEMAKLSWTAVPDAAGYNIYQGNTKVKEGLKATSFEVDGLQNGTEYTFTVATVNRAGRETAVSDPIKVTPVVLSGDLVVFDSDEFTAWNESLYAEWTQNQGLHHIEISYKIAGTSEYQKVDQELIRAKGNKYRVDIVGLRKNTEYDIKVVPFLNNIVTQGEMMFKGTTGAFDRSGYAHFDRGRKTEGTNEHIDTTIGVGAYKDDGTPKDDAIIIYLTEENKNTLTVPGFEQYGPGFGWIFNNAGSSATGAKNNTYATQKITANNPVIIRIIGKVTNPEGATIYNSTENGGTVGDNGHMVRIRYGKNITIEGIGDDAEMYDWGIHLMAGKGNPAGSFEVRNITFRDYPEDALGMEGVQESSNGLIAPVVRCWIHNNTFYPGYANPTTESDKKDGDGSCDFKRGRYYTLSYNYFQNCHKTNLIGSGDSSLQYQITMHHNFWDGVESRMPLARNANIHMYNNYFKGDITGARNVNVDLRANAYGFLEGNYYEDSKRPVLTQSGAAAKSYENIFYNCIENMDAVVVTDRAELVTNSNVYSDFDTNPNEFYYDAAAKGSVVENLTHAIIAKAECIAYSGAQKSEQLEPDNQYIIENEPSDFLTLPYTMMLDQGQLAEKTDIKELGKDVAVEIDNVVYKSSPSGSFKPGSTGGMKIKKEGIVFKIENSARVTLRGASGKNYPTLISKRGYVYLTGDGSVDVPAGTYTIQSDDYEKDFVLLSFELEQIPDIVSPEPPEYGESTTEENTETSTETTTESTTEAVTYPETEPENSPEEDILGNAEVGLDDAMLVLNMINSGSRDQAKDELHIHDWQWEKAAELSRKKDEDKVTVYSVLRIINMLLGNNPQ